MAETRLDDNQVGVMMGVLDTDGATPTRIKIDPSTHATATSAGTSGTDFGNDSAARDNNGMPTLLATDSNGDIITLYVNSSGQLLIKLT